ncbi:sulfite exporter TauE/SafE family protein [Desulforamulus aquiferis]|uniref:Probable membrane transporter protein n=1 Tax=Desulforamulus aquiferis TaxID=1397668 RepID=A0AAW7ZH62_9FIRM|nr:sulfite exporter TauE/SafE family protein [Desulforamulus aquiferis]MDO7789109.1 sulfite exporter TauE/SafE family protein [Desulforamulus aquiferis]RYD02865.1 membrane protein [Desulforamulus aquiferis]
MYFPVAGIEVAPWVPFVVGFLVAFFCSMGGVSGANLLLPFQMSFLGFTTPAVSATNHFFNIVAIPSGVYRFIKEGRMVWPLTWMVIAGTIPGVFLGVFARVQYLPDPKNFKFFAGLVLLYIGGMMVKALLKKPEPGSDKKSAERRFQELANQFRKSSEAAQQSGKEALPTAEVKKFSIKEMEYTFYGETYSVNPIIIFSLSALVGVIGGIYGIGGGAIIAPVFVAIFNLPVYTIAGACLMGTFLTSLTAVLFYQVIAPFYPHLAVAPDWILGLLFGFGGAVGMYLGARVQKFVPATIIKWILAIVLIFAASRYVIGFFM